MYNEIESFMIRTPFLRELALVVSRDKRNLLSHRAIVCSWIFEVPAKSARQQPK